VSEWVSAWGTEGVGEREGGKGWVSQEVDGKVNEGEGKKNASLSLLLFYFA
jgi:hypothetical protein